MRIILGAICVALILAWTDDATARKKKKKRVRRPATNSRLMQSAAFAPSASPAPAVEAEVPAPRAQHDHFLVATVLMQGDVRYSPGSIGLGLAYHLRLSERLRFVAGAGVGLRENRTLLEPTVGFEVGFLTLGPVELHALAGMSAPTQLMAGSIAVAVAGRGEIGVRWPVLDWLSPHAGVQVVVGPLVTPANLRWRSYAAVQLVVGARFGL